MRRTYQEIWDAFGELEWVDEDCPYLNGQIGLGNFAGCHTCFQWVGVS